MADGSTLDDFGLIDAYWRASNYLTIGQIYLQNNPLLREPLRAEHIKPRLLGHWGTSPGQNFVYVHLNRLIKEHDASFIYISGRGMAGRRSLRRFISKGPTRNFIRRSRRTSRGCGGCSASSLLPAVSRVMRGHTFRDRFMKAANLDIRWLTPLGPHSIILTYWLHA